MAGRPSASQVLDVWMNGELVGHWRYSTSKGHAFVYAASWLDSDYARSISLSMPLSNGETPFTGEVVEFYFDNLLPDSPDIRRRVASKFGAGSSKAFQLLEKIGRDCVGALQLLPAGSNAPDVRKVSAEPLTEQDVVNILDAAISPRSIGMNEEDELRISIAGAQEKTALLLHEGQWCRPHGTTPTTHIFKLPLGMVGNMQADFSSSVENEWLCAQLLRAYGLPVPTCGIGHFGQHKALVVERFDRKYENGWWIRLPQEDFCQVAGISSNQKYESQGGPGMAYILDKLRGSVNAAEDRRRFLMAQLLFWLMAAPDGHAKNFSISIGPKDSFWLTPLYDVMSAWPVIGAGANQFQWQKVKLAMALHAKNTHYKISEIRRKHWNEVVKDNAIGADFEDAIQMVIDKTPAVISQVEGLLGTDFPAGVSDRIFSGVMEQVERLKN
ncbi:MAG: type II toxin-antitoxin system HipA family toxin [Gammaproteobacteria bacterium]|nr:type II toxin-antitoxin system HipA family toxin [Gammaproteobacteria bacterium]MBU1968952.1 type II toxin-antitoxin system HipA family toxin [Gammaproteobacteria bacterium]